VPTLLAVGMLMGFGRAGASELRLSWDRCGSEGVNNKAFACGTNAGTDTLVVSYISNNNFPKLAHADIFMFVCFRQFILPDWWRVLGAGSCRLGALTATAAGPSASCTAIWDPLSGSTQQIHLNGGTTLNGFVFVVSVTAGDSARARDIVVGQELEFTRLVLDHTRTTGPGACTGCSIGADVGANFVWLYSTDGHNLGTSGGSYVTWQDATTACQAISPVLNRTWGAVKSLYR
jgi:hypothetical protein